HRNTTLISLYSHLARLISVPWLTTSERERVDRCIHILSLIADRRGLSHFLRSNSTSSEMSTRSRRTSRSATSERVHSVDAAYSAAQRHDHLEDVEHKRVIDNFVDFLSQVSVRLNPLIQAEVSVLVDVIRAPHALFSETHESRLKFLGGTFVHKLINHTTMMLIKYHEKQLSFHVLNLLTDYARTMQHKQILHWESNHEGQNLRLKLLRRYFSDDKQYLKSLHQPLKEEDAIERLRITQNELNTQGASDLVVELFMSESPINILEESVNLAIALLEGGNTEVQTSICRHLHGCETASEKFFQVFYDKMCIAQKTLKSMPSTTPDLEQRNDEFDDVVFTPRSGLISPIFSPSVIDRQTSVVVDQQSSMIPITDNDFNFDQQSTIISTVNSSEEGQRNFFNLYIMKSIEI
ncbi:unnamed protein product, partial [Rotaria sp. Silwood2]